MLNFHSVAWVPTKGYQKTARRYMYDVDKTDGTIQTIFIPETQTLQGYIYFEAKPLDGDRRRLDDAKMRVQISHEDGTMIQYDKKLTRYSKYRGTPNDGYFMVDFTSPKQIMSIEMDVTFKDEHQVSFHIIPSPDITDYESTSDDEGVHPYDPYN
eukprot:268268-Rhodomonas_salina.2